MSLRVFPISAVDGVHYADDFGSARSGGRSHQGNDLFAPEGTPILAPDDGFVKMNPYGAGGQPGPDPLGGNAFYLTADDGTLYYGAHLTDFEGGDRRVSAGDVIGYVGMTGNAEGTSPHLHFEVHPKGIGPVDPFPLLKSAELRKIGKPGGILPLLILAGLGAGAWYWYARAGGRRTIDRYARRLA